MRSFIAKYANAVLAALGWRIKPVLEKQLLNAVLCDGQMIGPLVWLLNATAPKLTPSLLRVDVEWLDSTRLGKRVEFTHQRAGESFGPKIDGEQEVASVLAPGVSYYEFDRAIVCPVSSAVYVDRRLIIERIPNTSPREFKYAGGYVMAHGERFAVIRISTILALESGFFLGGNGAFNYYHWLIEILPKLEFLRDPSIPILVCQDAVEIPTFRQALEAFCNLSRIVTLKRDCLYKVGKLYHLSSPIISPWNINDGAHNSVGHFLTRSTSLDFLIATLGISSWGDRAAAGRKLFLARKPTRRNYNQDEVFAGISDLDFEMVFLEDHTLQEQIKLISSAAIIIGPTGAAWTNLLFAQKGTKCLCWMDVYSAEAFAAFSNIAHHVGADLNYITYQSAASSPDQLYQGGYRLDPIAARAAVRRLLK